jgi:hypothetical protein
MNQWALSERWKLIDARKLDYYIWINKNWTRVKGGVYSILKKQHGKYNYNF